MSCDSCLFDYSEAEIDLAKLFRQGCEAQISKTQVKRSKQTSIVYADQTVATRTCDVLCCCVCTQNNIWTGNIL
jgi:hypothetical protein